MYNLVYTTQPVDCPNLSKMVAVWESVCCWVCVIHPNLLTLLKITPKKNMLKRYITPHKMTYDIWRGDILPMNIIMITYDYLVIRCQLIKEMCGKITSDITE